MKKLLLFVFIFYTFFLNAQPICKTCTEKQKVDFKLIEKYTYENQADSVFYIFDKLEKSKNKTNEAELDFLINYDKSFFYKIQNNFDSAGFYNQLCDALSKKYDNIEWQILTVRDKSELLFAQSKIKESIYNLIAIEDKVLQFGDTILKSKFYISLARYYLGYDTSIRSTKIPELLNKGLIVSEKLEFKIKNLNAKQILAYFYIDLKRFYEALTISKEVDQIVDIEKDPFKIITAQILSANCYLGLGDYKKANNLLNLCLEYGIKNKNYGISRMCYEALIKLETKKGNFKAALVWSEKANLFEVSTNTEENKVALATAKLNFEKKLKEKENTVLKNEVSFLKINLTSFKNKTLLIGILLMLGALAYFINNKIKNKQEKLKQEQFETETSLNHLRAQLNPHFMQNLFNSIYLQVAKDTEPEKIRMFIHEISQFFRQALVLNEKKVHSLDEELNFINQYLKLQQRICAAPLQWQINIADDIEEEKIEIPVMLLQPIVENCIKHGFDNGSKAGNITLSIGSELGTTNKLKTIFCSVFDDGLGNKAKNKLNNILNTSIGLKNCEERLQLFKKSNRNDKFFFTNFTNEGTLVKMYL